MPRDIKIVAWIDGLIKFLEDKKMITQWNDQKGKQASINRVAKAHLNRKAARGRKLDRGLRKDVNRALTRAGLDGSRFFRKPQEGWAFAFDVLARFNLEPDEIVSADMFRMVPGRTTVQVAYSNPEDPFSPESIANSLLSMQWGEAGDNGRYDFIAYMS